MYLYIYIHIEYVYTHVYIRSKLHVKQGYEQSFLQQNFYFIRKKLLCRVLVHMYLAESAMRGVFIRQILSDAGCVSTRAETWAYKIC